MRCPECNHDKCIQLRTREKHLAGESCVVRRRKCMACGHRFNTFENFDLADPEGAFVISEVTQKIDEVASILKSYSSQQKTDARIHTVKTN